MDLNRNIRLGLRTVNAINDALEADQGNLYRHYLQQVLPHIGDAYRQEKNDHRTHLGASTLGGDCARAIWYSFRWTTKGKFDGKTLRLFNRGHLEEARFIALLLMIGVQVYQQDENGNQFRITHLNGHIGGSGDGVGINIPDIPTGMSSLLEFKTHGDKSFKELWEVGVRESKFEHFVQMQVYMHKMGLPVGLYGAVNKNTDELYFEIIVLDSNFAEEMLNRSESIVLSEEPPKRISESPGYYKCKWCSHRMTCHRIAGAKVEVNCRTCVASKPLTSGEWLCTMYNRFLTKEDQIAACPSHKSRM